jgi:hypothetical protein
LPVNPVYRASGATRLNPCSKCGHSGLIQINIPESPPAYIDGVQQSQPMFAFTNGIKCYGSVTQDIGLKPIKRWQVH